MKFENLSTEYEATFCNIDINKTRKQIKKLGGKLLKPMFKQKRVNFYLPEGQEIKGAWLRVRDENDKITMSLKITGNNKSIDSQKEVELIVNSYENALTFLKTIGARKKSFQETKREIWEIEGVKLMIDIWPFLEPILEIEGKNENEVKKVAKKLGLNWSNAVFNSVDFIYSQKYKIPTEKINNHTPLIKFNMKNPFVNH